MSSPLEGRIRALAREEATALLGVATPDTGNPAPDRVATLEKEVAELRATVERLSAGQQATTRQSSQDERPATRRSRKAAE
jgi:hypothetical protein